MTVTLTERETQVFKLAGDGLSVQEIGDELGITANTVKTHLIHLRNKLGLGYKRELVKASREFFA
jgi:ATP/maltotriose-dependent transcriptional regulator MalT